ncbi:MAG: pyrroline-5-carboxylate reductase [Planctomycetes bacterium]|nr:pyrroline-5-carboxylate reductase [Planctomycetota bacterium]
MIWISYGCPGLLPAENHSGGWIVSTINTIGLIGAGKMATALAVAWVERGLARRIVASDPFAPARESFAKAVQATVSDDNAGVAALADVLVLAIKPQKLEEVMEPLRGNPAMAKPVISILAGASTARLEKALGHGRVVRVMPNTPCLVGESATGICAGPAATAADMAMVKSLFGAVGKVHEVPEGQLDAVTGLSGSGPAYVFQIIEALADGGVLSGLPRETALALAAQTVLGAAKMVLATGRHPGQLKDDVASPAGTTIAGLLALEQGGLRASLMNAVAAATRRSRELGG